MNNLEKLSTEYLMKEAFALQSNNEKNAAIKIYKKIIKNEKMNSDARHNLAIIYHQSNNGLKALIYLVQALRINPTIAQYWYSYIEVLISIYMIDEAISHLNLAIKLGISKNIQNDLLRKLKSNNHYKNIYIEKLYTKISKLEKINENKKLKLYLKITKIKYISYEEYEKIGYIFYFQKKYIESLKYLKMSYAGNTGNSDLLSNIGAISFLSKNIEEARAYSKLAIELNPKKKEAYNTLGSICYAAEEYEESIKYYKK